MISSHRGIVGKCLGFLFIVFFLCLPALAHPMDEWFAEMHWTDGQGLQGRLRVPGDQRDRLHRLPLIIEVDGRLLQVTFSDVAIDENERALVDVSAISGERPSSVTLTLPDGLLDENQSVVGFFRFGDSEPVTLMVPAGQSRTITVPVANEQTANTKMDLRAFFNLGVEHILIGFDHLLFLFCLLIGGGTLRNLVVVVTAFTVGHSITLALSVLGFVALPSRYIESAIALSIVVAALWNLRPGNESEEADKIKSNQMQRGFMAGGFGLIHGLGFATMLLENGLAGASVVVPLLGFNLGVEAGQLGFVLMFYPVLWAIHRSKYRHQIVVISSLLAAACGFYWFLERLGVF